MTRACIVQSARKSVQEGGKELGPKDFQHQAKPFREGWGAVCFHDHVSVYVCVCFLFLIWQMHVKKTEECEGYYILSI